MTDLEFEALARRERVQLVCSLATTFRHDDADDAVAEALLIVWRHRRRIDRATAGGYLHIVARNEALALVRRRRREVSDYDLARHPADQPDIFDMVARRLEADRVARLLLWLKPDDAKALVLAAAGHSYQEIARTHGWTNTKVNRCVGRGRAALRELRAA
jgi:RNA polymerase sigma factor (sigma-70 family)